MFCLLLGANHKTLHRLSQATAAHHPLLVRVRVVSTTAHHHHPLNVHHLKRHRVWTTTTTAAIWSTTSISSRQRKSNESVTTRSPTRSAWDRQTSTMVAMATLERGTMMTIMGEWLTVMTKTCVIKLTLSLSLSFRCSSSNTTPTSLEDSGCNLSFSVMAADAINKRIASPINGGQSKSSSSSSSNNNNNNTTTSCSTEQRSQRNGNRTSGTTQTNNNNNKTTSSSNDIAGNSDDGFRESLSKNGSTKSGFR